MFNIPAAVLALVVVLGGIHILRELITPAADLRLVLDYGFIPARVTLWLDPEQLDEILAFTLGSTPSQPRVQFLTQVLREDGPLIWSGLTYAFLHGSPSHLISNVLWLVVFGSPVARRLGLMRFVAIAALTALGGAAMHYLARPLEAVPMIGASAIVSGVTAAAATFVFAPGLRFGSLASDAGARAVRREHLFMLLRNPRAMTFIAFWFASNLIFGGGVIPLFGEGSQIAWEAHIGGFLAGLVAFLALDQGSRRGSDPQP
jgi:membrane associated rhomboid family serine protease